MLIDAAKQILAVPVAFEAYQYLVGAPGCHRRFIRDFIQPQAGESILDVGCGTGVSLHYLPPKLRYVGIDLSEAYIERAKQRFGQQGTFIAGDASSVTETLPGGFDRAFANGVLHHVPDEVASKIISDVLKVLRPGGTFTTIDPTLHEGQSAISRYIVDNDRGQFVRTPKAMTAIYAPFGTPTVRLVTDMLRIPFSQVIVTLRKPGANESA